MTQTHEAEKQEPDRLDAERWRNLCEIDGALDAFTAAYYNTTTKEELEVNFDAYLDAAKEIK